MAYLLVEDFRYGMDRRRKRVAGTPGTLWVGKNVHITRGGDVERRKKFDPTYYVPNTFGVAAIRSQLYVFGTLDLAASMPVGVQYQRLLAPPATPAMSAILAVKAFSGKLYVIAEFVDGNVYHFYDGTRLTDWDVISSANADFPTLASTLAAKLDSSSVVKAVSFGASVLVTALVAGTGFTLTKGTANSGSVNDQDIVLTTIQANVVAVAEVRASATVTITNGTEGDENYIGSIVVNNVQLLSGNVKWSGSNAATAIRLASAVNVGTATHGYYATANGASIVLQAAIGTGATPNGYDVVVVPHGDVTTTASATFTGGVAAVVAQKQVVRATLTGTVEAADLFALYMNGVTYQATVRSSGVGRSLFVDKSRVWSPVGSLWRYSMLNRADVWDPARVLTGNDSGFINIASQAEGNEQIQIVARYQGLAAIFSPDNIVLFQLDTNPANFAFSDTMENTGTNSVDSVARYGNNDVFYLDITGIRSLRARDSSNAPFVSDIGNSIDTFVAEQLALLTGGQVKRAVAAIEPIDGRYLLFAGNIAFVLSYFPGAKISAWSYYGLEEFGGNDVQAAVRVRNRMVVRAGDYLHVYGGENGDVYPNDNEVVAEVETPFLSGKTPATIKEITGFDSAATNTWEIELAFDPNDDARTTNVGRLSQITFADVNKVAVPGNTSMVAIKAVCRTAGPASVSMLALHYEGEDAG